ncbi:MAG: hypothetical protein GXY83_20825 [Rhodopirellula sp.]|nr:hypothetical protein [Rhodopirellula sp.]
MALSEGYRRNFDVLRRAFCAGDAALMECRMAATDETTAVICAANRLPDGAVEFVPFATMFSGNPYEEINPPKPDGGFWSQEEVHG